VSRGPERFHAWLERHPVAVLPVCGVVLGALSLAECTRIVLVALALCSPLILLSRLGSPASRLTSGATMVLEHLLGVSPLAALLLTPPPEAPIPDLVTSPLTVAAITFRASATDSSIATLTTPGTAGITSATGSSLETRPSPSRRARPGGLNLIVLAHGGPLSLGCLGRRPRLTTWQGSGGGTSISTRPATTYSSLGRTKLSQKGSTMLPQQIMLVREVGDDEWPYWLAASLDGREPLLEQRERILWRGQVRVSEKQPGKWQLPDNTQLFVTDRRTIFLTQEFDKGGGWLGFGVVGLTVATTANVVSKRRAAQRSAGRVAIGQIRHEWLGGILLRRVKALIGGTDTYVDLLVASSGGPRAIELWGRATADENYVRWLASVVAQQRQGIDVPWTEEALIRLERYRAGQHDAAPSGNPDSLWWIFPGEHESLIASCIRSNEQSAVSWENSVSGPTAGWFPDPIRGAVRHRRRWWDGDRWTQRTDPPLEDEELAPDGALTELPAPQANGQSAAAAPHAAISKETPTVAAGWYPDPLRGSAAHRRRWWDGSTWTDRTDPAPSEAQPTVSAADLLALKAPGPRRS
jgi:Protein of unknown function (DUF2510)